MKIVYQFGNIFGRYPTAAGTRSAPPTADDRDLRGTALLLAILFLPDSAPARNDANVEFTLA